MSVKQILDNARQSGSQSGDKISYFELHNAFREAKRADAANPTAPALTAAEVKLFEDIADSQMTRAAANLRSRLISRDIPAVLQLQQPVVVTPPAVRPGFDANGKPTVVGSDGIAARPSGSPQRSASTTSQLQSKWYYRDAATAWVYANNTTMRQTTYGYGTHKPRDAYIDRAPANGMLDLTMIFTPSTHVGSDNASKRRNFEKYAKENTYRLRVQFPDGTVVMLPKQGETIRNRPAGTAEYATAWDIQIPLMKGDTIISGWPNGTGAGGYIERRQTVIHYDGQ